MKRLKTTFCMPCKELFEWKKEKPMNLYKMSYPSHLTVGLVTYNADARPRITLPQMYEGVRQYCWNILTVQQRIWVKRFIANSLVSPESTLDSITPVS
jgi:hypothetical protein